MKVPDDIILTIRPKHPRPVKLSDPGSDFSPEELEAIIRKKDADLTDTDLICIFQGVLPAGKYDEAVYFLPLALERICGSDDDGATWVTSMFLHDGFLPLIGNMYCLWLFGDNVEDELGKIGYLGFILLSGFTASLCYLLFNTGATLPCIGAGGFIAGIIALYAVLYPKVTIGITGCSRMLVAIPAWLVFVLWALFQLVMTYLTYGSKNGGVAFAAHLGGAIPGLICGFIIRCIRARRAEEFDL